MEKFDEIISGWGLYWGIGPGLKKEKSLTISPNNDPKLLVQASGTINRAPTISDWEFYFFKQPKINWDNVEIGGVNIEASN